MAHLGRVSAANIDWEGFEWPQGQVDPEKIAYLERTVENLTVQVTGLTIRLSLLETQLDIVEEKVDKTARKRAAKGVKADGGTAGEQA